jgi:hypothetical protein
VGDKALVMCMSRNSCIRIVRIDEIIVCTLAREGCRGLLIDQYIRRALDPLQGRESNIGSKTANSQFGRPKPYSFK